MLCLMTASDSVDCCG